MTADQSREPRLRGTASEPGFWVRAENPGCEGHHRSQGSGSEQRTQAPRDIIGAWVLGQSREPRLRGTSSEPGFWVRAENPGSEGHHRSQRTQALRDSIGAWVLGQSREPRLQGTSSEPGFWVRAENPGSKGHHRSQGSGSEQRTQAPRDSIGARVLGQSREPRLRGTSSEPGFWVRAENPDSEGHHRSLGSGSEQRTQTPKDIIGAWVLGQSREPRLQGTSSEPGFWVRAENPGSKGHHRSLGSGSEQRTQAPRDIIGAWVLGQSREPRLQGTASEPGLWVRYRSSILPTDPVMRVQSERF